MWKIFDEI